MENVQERIKELTDAAVGWLTSAAFYGQLGIIAVSVILAYLAAGLIGTQLTSLPKFKAPDFVGDLDEQVAKLRKLLFPLVAVLLLAVGVEVSREVTGQVAVVQIALGLFVIILIYGIVSRYISSRAVRNFVKWVGLPIALLYVFGFLDDVIARLEAVSLDMGNIEISAYTLVRTLIFGSILFWLGRVSNSTGKRVIRGRPDLDVRTREIVTKLFEIALFIIIFLLLLQVMGINLTTLAVFGGAVGVGLGFGLQQIASNFISGIIILLDKSITIGDYIELEDGRGGILREMTMRSATLETFDGKDIMVPNETFITSSFVNWTHNNPQQRYDIRFQVAYSTDIPAMLDIVREVVKSHPQVLSGEAATKAEQPDAEIEGFGDSGIDILVEFWMDGVDDGENRVAADLNLMIWMALKQHNIEIPFPQREVRVLKEG
ncbi:mechanosensitive ion channel protein [Parvularcula marina]|uniref:Mechanosensitive ion channel protein n=2 Tax=Parvularcula marina TaxID=2292771 RepID=A0A371RLN3_9PROT|nr:mechanosensitive ion channel protein [Parvularcula marina]